MIGPTMPMTFAGVEVLVQTVQDPPGTQPTSVLGSAGAKALDAFGKAQDAIVGAAISTVDVMRRLAAEDARPDKLEIEFGIAFSIKGNLIVTGGSADTTLKVKLTYESPTEE